MNIEHRRIPVSKSLVQCCLSYMHIHNILDQTPFSALRCWALRPGGVWRPSYMGCLYRRRPASSWIFIRWISCNSQQSHLYIAEWFAQWRLFAVTENIHLSKNVDYLIQQISFIQQHRAACWPACSKRSQRCNCRRETAHSSASYGKCSL